METKGEIKSIDNGQFVYVLNGSTSKPYPSLDAIQKRFPLAAVEGLEPFHATEEVEEVTVEKPKKAKKGKK